MPSNEEIEAIKKKALARGLRVESTDQLSPEELNAYIKEIEAAYLTKEEQQLALQAAADLAEGERLARDRALRQIKAQKRAFKGIYNRSDFIRMAKDALRRAEILQKRALEEAQEKQNED